MSIFGTIAKAFKSVGAEINKEYGNSHDFLNGVTASVALIAMADGTLEESERKSAIDTLTGHPGISSLYSRSDIENTLSSALNSAKTQSGKQVLARYLDVCADKGAEMAKDVYLVALDVSGSNSRGEAGDDEKRVLGLIAKHLHVDVSSIDQF